MSSIDESFHQNDGDRREIVNTPAHALLGVALLARGDRRPFALAALAGSVLPDLPIFVFFFWQRVVIGLPEQQIFGEAYFRTPWQDFFDLFNSLPLIAACWLVARALGSVRGQVGSAAALLHGMCDLPLHREDAHRRFFPFSDWRFSSPVSYWDPAHFGMAWSTLEGVGVLALSWLLWRRFPNRLARASLALVCGATLAGWFILLTLFDAVPQP